jgi:hypothetical protein
MNYEILNKHIFTDEDKSVSSTIKVLNEDKQILLSSTSHIHAWFGPKFIYNDDLNYKYLKHGHMHDRSQSIELRLYKNSYINFPNDPNKTIDPKHGSQYSLTIDNYPKHQPIKQFDKIAPFIGFQSWSWQHFIQDMYHTMVWSMDFLKENSDIVLILDIPRLGFHSLEYLIRHYLGLQNKIEYLDIYDGNKDTLYANEIYFTSICPDIQYSCPPMLRRLVNKTILAKHTPTPQKYLSLITRRHCSTRIIPNENILIELLTNYSKQIGLEFKLIDTNTSDYKELFEITNQSKIIIAPHGGGCYHMYWCQPDTIFIEIEARYELISMYHIACSIGLNYWICQSDVKWNAKYYPIDFNKIIGILDTLKLN